MPAKNGRSFWMSIDILNVLSRADRLHLLILLKSGRQPVSELTHAVHGSNTHNHCSQTSTALAPLRRVGLVNALRHGRHVFYELTDLGRVAVDFVEVIHEQLTHRDAILDHRS